MIIGLVKSSKLSLPIKTANTYKIKAVKYNIKAEFTLSIYHLFEV